MPVSNANPGFGCLLAIGDGASPEVFDDLAEITAVNDIGIAHRTDEVTHMSSPNGWAEHIGLGVKDFKPFTLNLNFVADDTDQILLIQTRAAAGTAHNYRVKFTDDGDTTVTFAAIVNDVTLTHARDSKAEAVVSFLPTGAPTWA